MRLHILSDLHLEFWDFLPKPTAADVVILAGDIHVGRLGRRWIRKAFGDAPVVYVLGNHEFYNKSLPNLFETF
jgi:predicted phosphodiesterase